MGSSNPDLSILKRDADYCVATWDRVFIQVWRYTPTRRAVMEMQEMATAFVAAQPSGRISSVGIAEATSPSPNREARAEFARFFRAIAPHVDESIVVPLGGGMRGAVIRGVGVALSSMTPGGLRFRFVDNIARAAELAAPHLSPEASGARALEAALEEARVIANTASADKAWRSG